jgi:hypothetical protein
MTSFLSGTACGTSASFRYNAARTSSTYATRTAVLLRHCKPGTARGFRIGRAEALDGSDRGALVRWLALPSGTLGARLPAVRPPERLGYRLAHRWRSSRSDAIVVGTLRQTGIATRHPIRIAHLSMGRSDPPRALDQRLDDRRTAARRGAVRALRRCFRGARVLRRWLRLSGYRHQSSHVQYWSHASRLRKPTDHRPHQAFHTAYQHRCQCTNPAAPPARLHGGIDHGIGDWIRNQHAGTATGRRSANLFL